VLHFGLMTPASIAPVVPAVLGVAAVCLIVDHEVITRAGRIYRPSTSLV
jgi:hypothetical protein